MASEAYPIQIALNTCPDHGHVEMEMYCKTCKKPVCIKCLKEDHHEHDWDSLKEMAKELRKQTTQRKLLTESVSKPILFGTEEFLNSLASISDNELEYNCSALEKKRKSIVEFVNKSIDEMKSKCKESHKLKMKPKDERREKMKSLGERIKFLTQNMAIGARDYTDSDLIELHDEINRILNDLQALSELPKCLHEMMAYKPGTSEPTSLESLVGKVESGQSAPEAIFENEFNISDTAVNTIHLTSEREAWVHPSQTTINHLVDSSGTIKQTVDLGCRLYDFTVSNKEYMYFCDILTNTVKQIDKQGKIKSLFSTAPLIPLYITLTRSGDLLITLVDEISYNRISSSRRLVRRNSMSGEVMKEYEYDNDGNTPLFCVSWRPVEHFNGNICIIKKYKDNSDNVRSILYCLNHNGNVIFRYGGTDAGFKPMDICCDNEGNILMSHLYQKVHIIDFRGNFLRFLLTENSFDENLGAIDLIGSKLWIGSRDSGIVKVFKLKYGLRK